MHYDTLLPTMPHNTLLPACGGAGGVATSAKPLTPLINTRTAVTSSLKSIIINNLYGVDIMEEAIEICKLRALPQNGGTDR